MADLGDVLDALQTLVSLALYPAQPAVLGTSTAGVDAAIGVGWPDNAELDDALAHSRAYVAVFPQEGERVRVEWPYDEQEVPRVANGLHVAFNPDTSVATFTGTATVNDVLGVLYDGVAYTYDLTAGVTPANVATFIAATLPVTVVVNGGAVTLPYRPDISFRLGKNGYSIKTLNSVSRRLQVNIWAPDQPSRDAVSRVLLPAIQQAQFLSVPALGGAVMEAAHISVAGSNWSDRPQNAGGYLRSLIALVEWQTTVYETVYDILFVGGNVNTERFGPAIYAEIMAQALVYNGVPIVRGGNFLTYTP